MNLKLKEWIAKVTAWIPQKSTWTPRLYDLNTFKVAGDPYPVYKIGNIYLYCIDMDWLAKDFGAINIGTMLQIRNFSGMCWGGSIFVRGSINRSATWIQPANNAVYLRENITGTISKAYNGKVAGYFLVIDN